jgi:hypothetical protein
MAQNSHKIKAVRTEERLDLVTWPGAVKSLQPIGEFDRCIAAKSAFNAQVRATA